MSKPREFKPLEKLTPIMEDDENNEASKLNKSDNNVVGPDVEPSKKPKQNLFAQTAKQSTTVPSQQPPTQKRSRTKAQLLESIFDLNLNSRIASSIYQESEAWRITLKTTLTAITRSFKSNINEYHASHPHSEGKEDRNRIKERLHLCINKIANPNATLEDLKAEIKDIGLDAKNTHDAKKHTVTRLGPLSKLFDTLKKEFPDIHFEAAHTQSTPSVHKKSGAR